MSGRGIQAGLNGFMNGFNFVHGIQRQDALDAERRANRKADIQHRNSREAVTDDRMERNFKLQQETATYNRDRQDSLDAERRANREEDTKRQNDHWEKTYNAQQDAAAQKNLEKKQVQIAGWTYYALKDLANAKTQEERERISGTIAKGINQLPIFQEAYGVGGDTGRNATGIELLPNGSYSVTIHNEHTGTTGPMTHGASADKNDTVFTIDPAQVAVIAGIKIDNTKGIINVDQKDYTHDSFVAFRKSGNRSDLVPYREAGGSKTKPIPANVLKLAMEQARSEAAALDPVGPNFMRPDAMEKAYGKGITKQQWITNKAGQIVKGWGYSMPEQAQISNQPVQPTKEKGQSSPPVQGARQAKDGKWYVHKNNQWYEVVK